MTEQKHSRAYHRYFEDYAERQILDESGRLTTQRIYVGNYYRTKLSDTRLLRQRTCFVLLYLSAVILYLGAGVTLRISALWVVALFTAAALLALLWLAIPIFHRLTAPREMEVRAWRESAVSLRHVSVAAAVCLLLCAGITLAAAFIFPGYSMSETALGAALYALAGILLLGIYFLERWTEYEVLPPKNQRPEGSSPIRYYMPD